MNEAAFQANVKDLKHLVNCGNKIDQKLSIFGEAPIHKAVLSKLKVAEKSLALHAIIDSKANMDNMDSNGWTALHHAAYNGDIESATILIRDGGANVNAYSNKQRTPLHFAAHNNHKVIIQLLLANGADLEWPDAEKCTPLHIACKRGHTESVSLLLNSNANIYAQDMRQWTSLHYSAYNGYGKVCNQLLKWEADKDILRDMQNSQHKKPIHICKNAESKEGFKSKLQAPYKFSNLYLFRHLEIVQRWKLGPCENLDPRGPRHKRADSASVEHSPSYSISLWPLPHCKVPS